MLADVAEAGRAEQRVGDRVGDDVGVAVAGEAGAAVEGDAAEHERAIGVRVEGMHVEALADPDRHQRHRQRGNSQVGGRRDLAVRGLALDDHDPAAGGLDERGIVGGFSLVAMGSLEGRQRGRPAASGPSRGENGRASR